MIIQVSVAVPDPDLETRGGGQSSRPLDKGGRSQFGLKKWFHHCVVLNRTVVIDSG